eukprot:symbB.v1.2.011614.t1/scaffold783.1/size170700/8
MLMFDLAETEFILPSHSSSRLGLTAFAVAPVICGPTLSAYTAAQFSKMPVLGICNMGSSLPSHSFG